MIRSRKEAIASIKFRSRTIRGCKVDSYSCYLGSLPDGTKVRLYASTEKALREKVAEYYHRQQVMGDSALVLKPMQVWDARQALELLKAEGVKLSLTEAVKAFLEGQANVSTIEDLKVGIAYDRYRESLTSQSDVQIRCVERRVKPWVQEFGVDRFLTEVTKDEFQRYAQNLKKVASKGYGRTAKTSAKVSPKTRNGVITYCKTFMQWCVNEGYLATNPLAKIKTETIAYKEPEYSTVEDVRRLFALLKQNGNKKMIAYAALSFFCGIRTAEIDRIVEDPKAFVLEDDTIRIITPKGYTKGMMPRIIKVEPNAKAWLLYANAPVEMYQGAKMSSIQILMHRLVEKHGIPYPKNAGRHSFITYHVAAYQDPTRTEALAGTSARMRARHYMGLATVAQGQEYFSIMP